MSVVDVNEYSPVFLEPSYVKQVDEGRLFDQIIRVEATDRDCTAKFGDICKYEILTLDQPFAIDMDGKKELQEITLNYIKDFSQQRTKELFPRWKLLYIRFFMYFLFVELNTIIMKRKRKRKRKLGESFVEVSDSNLSLISS